MSGRAIGMVFNLTIEPTLFVFSYDEGSPRVSLLEGSLPGAEDVKGERNASLIIPCSHET